MDLQSNWKSVLQTLSTSASTVDSQWIKRHRKVDTLKLITCMLTCLQHKVSIKSIIDTIDSCDFSHTAFTKALNRCPEDVFHSMYRRLVGSTTRSRVLAVDGSRIPLTKSQTGTRAGRTRSTPMGLLSAIYDVNTKVIVALDFSEHYDERSALKRMTTYVKAGDILVMDRGYFSEDLVALLYSQGIRFVFRMKDKVGTKKFKSIGNNIYRTTKHTPVVITKYNAGGTLFRVLHSMKISATQAKNIYKQRWDIEEVFKTLKCTIRMNASHLRTHAKTTFKKQMWVCACMHYLQQRVVHNITRNPNNRRPPNGVQVVKWLMYKLCGGHSDRVRFCEMYSVTGNRRRRNRAEHAPT